MATVLGTSVKRREDPALVAGEGKYTDDFKLPGMLHAAIVRSPHAHARITRIDTARAAAHPGVVAVFTWQDVKAHNVPGTLPTGWLLPGLKTPVHQILASEVVRYVGDAVAVVVADDRYVAEDASELVEVDYEPLDAVADVKAAAEPGAPLVHADAPGNIAFEWELGDKTRTDAAFAGAARTVSLSLRNNRMLASPIEPRSVLASWDHNTSGLTIRMTSQNPHVHRLFLSIASLGVPEHRIRVIAPEVGGGFGGKIHHYADEAITAFCAMRTGQPVKWTSTRSEANRVDAHGRDHVSVGELALDADGHVLGLRVHTYAAMGAYLSTFAPAVPTYLYGTLLSGQYAIPAIHVKVVSTFTHTAPVDAVRGAGRPEATFLIERLMDHAARELNLDPAEIRRRNFVPPDQFPFQTQVALQYDSGNYAPALEKALEMAGYKALREEQAKRRREGGKLLGIGLSAYIEACGLAPSQVVGALGAQAGLWESAKVRIHPTGTITVFVGTSAHGQSHKTTYAQIVAARLGLDVDKIDIVQGDTQEVQFGMGTYGSRSAAVGGSAIALSVDKMIAKGKKIAAHLLEAAEGDIEFDNGSFHVKGVPSKARSWGEVVLQAYLAHNLPADVEPGMEATTFYNPSNFTYPFGTHVAVVEIDPETGETKILRYVGVDDVGNVINPMIVAGQLHGGIAHGIGQALFEQVIYDENGQLLTGELMDYALPKAHQLVSFELGSTVTPCPHNPLGVKGVGEAGAIAAPAAIINAVVDALGPYGITHVDMPATPARVWKAIQGARS